MFVVLAGCYKDPHFKDCELACTDSCPGNLTCVAGACREPGMTGPCMVQPGVDAATDGTPDVLDAFVDSDSDGIADSVDNCPMTPNTDQANEDGDKFGDVCDKCPIVNTGNVDPDGDSDGVGDGCDPNKTIPGEQIVVFEGFNGTSMPAGSTGFNGQWQFTNGQAKVNSTGGVQAKLVWPLTGTKQTVYTRVSMTHNGTPAYAGVTSVANSAVGISCVDHVDPTLTTNLQLTDGTSSNTAANSGFTEGSADSLALVRNGSTNWSCQRVGGPTINSALNQGGLNIGLFAEEAVATFDYVMIVTSP